MLHPLTEHIQQRLASGWLPAPQERARFEQAFACGVGAIEPGDDVLVAEREPVAFAAVVLAALAKQANVTLGAPDWGTRQWAEVVAQLRPGKVFGEGVLPASPAPLGPVASAWDAVSGPLIRIPTGGSGGRVKFAVHTPQSLTVAVDGLLAFLQTSRLSAMCCLPLYHVSGFMQVWRSLFSEGHLRFCRPADVVDGQLPDFDLEAFQLSLPPTVLHRCLRQKAGLPALRRVGTIWLGGAAASDELLDSALAEGLDPWLVYGATETAAMIAARQASAARRAGQLAGSLLPHAAVEICEGEIRVRSKALFSGYWASGPLPEATGYWASGDAGALDEQGRLQVFGRLDSLINTGGEKVFPPVVEEAIRRVCGISDVVVLGTPDPEWGQRVTAFCVAGDVPADAEERWGKALRECLRPHLAPHMLPTKWVPVKAIPVDARGKVQQKLLLETLGR